MVLGDANQPRMGQEEIMMMKPYYQDDAVTICRCCGTIIPLFVPRTTLEEKYPICSGCRYPRTGLECKGDAEPLLPDWYDSWGNVVAAYEELA